MIRQAVISGGVAYHYNLTQPGQPLDGFEVIDLAHLAQVDLNAFDVVVVPRSTDGEMLHARRYQIARYLDNGGVLLAFGELWANWFPGCNWQAECTEDLEEPVIVGNHPLVAGFSPRVLHWHPSIERWCCHGHLIAPSEAEVIVQNAHGDAWLYIDRTTTKGVILASTNLDPDTHTYHGHEIAKILLERMVAWAQTEAEQIHVCRQSRVKKIAGLYSGVYFQQSFYENPEFESRFAILPVLELPGANLHDFAALWIPRESNQNMLLQNRQKLLQYLQEGGTIICFDEVSQPWLPVGTWTHRPVKLSTVCVENHPIVAHLTPSQVRWHSHGAYQAYDNADILIHDDQGGVMLFLDERSFFGKLLAGTLDPDCHAGFGTEITRPLLRAILEWVKTIQLEQNKILPMEINELEIKGRISNLQSLNEDNLCAFLFPVR